MKRVNWKRWQGEFQKHLMIFGVNRKYLSSSIGFVSSIGLAISSKLFVKEQSKLGLFLAVGTVIVSSAVAVYTFITETREYIERQNEMIEADRGSYKKQVLSKIKLSKRYVDSQYKIMNHGNEQYIMSHEVNGLLKETAGKMKLKLSGQFILSRELIELVPFAIRSEFGNKTFLYNSSLVRLVDDFYIEDLTSIRDASNGVDFRIQKTDYFHGLCTNELAYKRIRFVRELGTQKYFDGEKIILDGDELLELSQSWCANYLGGSTLALTKDRQLVIAKQPKRSGVNGDRMAPSGSGSTDFKDFKRIREDATYEKLVVATMERELREECSLSKRVRMKTMIIGHARLVERGGKPDFFGITYLDCNFSDIKVSRKEVIQMGEYCHEPIGVNDVQRISPLLKKYIADAGESNISIQLAIFANILEWYEGNHVFPYEELMG